MEGTRLLRGPCEIEKDGPDGGNEEEDEDGREDQEDRVPVPTVSVTHLEAWMARTFSRWSLQFRIYS